MARHAVMLVSLLLLFGCGQRAHLGAQQVAAAPESAANARFAATATTRRPRLLMRSAVALSAPASRAQIAMFAPSRASSSAIAAPMPLLPPVTSATLPDSPRSIRG